jgi:hypothetical protein
MKYGLWEDGKRIEWIEPDQAQKIMKGAFDYRGSFKKAESAQNLEYFKNTFNRPTNFDHRLSEIKA